MARKAEKGSSILAVEELFSRADPDFLDELRKHSNSAQLAGFADRWKKDPRPWARQQTLEYLDLPLDSPGHHPVVKRLFKQAEAANDDELMASFLVAFDRLIRRVRRQRQRYEWNSAMRESVIHQEEWLAAPRNSILPQRPPTRSAVNPRTGERIDVPRQVRIPRDGVLFSYHTRRYLRRRAWRYFRRLGYQRPHDYVQSIARALVLYRDEDLARGENILDSWGLAHALFHHHSALEFNTSSVVLREGHTLSDLHPAPYFPELWRTPPARGTLLDLIFTARSRLVRMWAMQLLVREHQAALDDLPVETLVRLIDHADEEIQQFGADLLAANKRVAHWPVDTWLQLLEIQNPSALATICEAMRKHVSGSRIDLAQCLQLACAEPTPVARLGLEFLSARTFSTPEERQQLSKLGEARCAATSAELARFALSIAGTPQSYDLEIITRLFDSLLAEMRQAAWEWLIAPSPGYNDPVLWSRLLETPFDDLRLRLIDHLAIRVADTRQAESLSYKDAKLAPVWCSVLLGVHRGGRQKAKAAAQVAEAIAASPDQAAELLPVLAASLRSVRKPEFRSGLAAVVAILESRPELTPLVRQQLPELDLVEVQA